MTRLVMLGCILLGLLPACTQSSFRVGEGILCSTDDDDEPFFTCDIGLGDLICINTYKVQETPAWVCRRACATAEECPLSDDVCCEGPIEGETFGKSRACVPRGLCEGSFIPRVPTPRPDASVRDAAVRDAGPVEDAAADMSLAPDAPMSMMDAGLDTEADASADAAND